MFVAVPYNVKVYVIVCCYPLHRRSCVRVSVAVPYSDGVSVCECLLLSLPALEWVHMCLAVPYSVGVCECLLLYPAALECV